MDDNEKNKLKFELEEIKNKYIEMNKLIKKDMEEKEKEFNRIKNIPIPSIGELKDNINKAIEKLEEESNLKECYRRIERCKKQHKKKLILSYLYLEELPDALSNLFWLKELVLSDNKLKILPDWIGNFTELTKLDLSSNELTMLPDSIGNLAKLKIIDLSNNRLNTLPETFGNLASLEVFKLWEQHNHPAVEEKFGQGSWFTRLPESFGNLSSLKVFYVSDTRLSGLPESFGNLKSLVSLTIGETITDGFYFPERMKNLEELREINISGFDHVPDFIGELRNLTILDISHNKLGFLPDFIRNLTKLKEINLHSTWITKLPDWIANLENLNITDMDSDLEIENTEIIKKLTDV